MLNKVNKSILIIMDGVGVREETHGNAFALANKPNLDYLFKTYPNTTLLASEEAVGLPHGQMGNSEVGHLNIGAGRIVYTGLSLINKEISDGTFFKNVAFLNAIDHALKNNSKLHIIGLCSHGGVHSSWEHIENLIKLCNTKKVKTILHVISDGRDVNPKQMMKDIDIIINVCKTNHCLIGSISGRFYAMDRDKRWDRTEKYYDVLSGDSSNYFGDIKKYIIEQYKQNIFDEFIVPAINKQLINDVKLENNDSVIFANFRPDRARQISHLIFGSNYYDYKPNIKKQNLYFVTMMSYEGIAPSSIAYPPIKLKNVFGKVLENNNIKQLRISETEKYAHVTFFFDGGEEIDYKKETKIIIPSPKVATYDLQPEMSANLICDELLKQMNSNDVIIVNFANGDMVGHTGKLEPTIKAIECVDKQIGKIYELSKKLNFTLFITADHGNADMVIDDKNNPVTSHTLNPVPFIITSDKYKIIKTIGKLCDIVPTILYHMNIDKPDEMTGNNLIINKK